MPKKNKPIPDQNALCYGTATVGEKGQFVIPSDARKDLNIKSGDKLLIFGSPNQVMAVIKADDITDLVTGLSEQIRGAGDLAGGE